MKPAVPRLAEGGRIRLVAMIGYNGIGRFLKFVVWFRVQGCDRTILVLSSVIP